MRSRRILETAALVAFVLFARLSAATTIAYDEAISGDLGDTFPATAFTLDIGSNTIMGTTHFFANPGVNSDFDQFALVVPVGLHVTDITFAFQTQTLPGTNTTVAKAEYRLDNGNATPASPFLGDLNIDLLGASPLHPFAGAFPLGAGTFTLAEALVTTTSPGGWTAEP